MAREAFYQDIILYVNFFYFTSEKDSKPEKGILFGSDICFDKNGAFIHSRERSAYNWSARWIEVRRKILNKSFLSVETSDWLREMPVLPWKTIEFSEMKLEKRELEANLTSIRLELSENEHLKLDAEIKRDDLAKVGFQNDIFIWKPSSEIH